MTSSPQRETPPPGSRRQPPNRPGSDEVIAALSRALDIAAPDRQLLTIDRQRLAGRSSIYFVSAPTLPRPSSKWVVKVPHHDWSQDDLESPVTARQEFEALVRLHGHFQRAGGPMRVPEPVALLVELGGLAMEYVAGRTIRSLLNYGSARQPSTLLHGLSAAGQFLRQVHDLDAFAARPVDLRQQAAQILSLAEERLPPLGLTMPARVSQTLAHLQPLTVTALQVRLHGDFGPGNILLAADGTTVGLDAALVTVGAPEDDLARFIAVMAGSIRFAPEVIARPSTALRRRLEIQLLRSYYGSATIPPLFELRLLRQLVGRWCRLRELAEQSQRRALLPLRLRVIGAQMRLLMEESAARLQSGAA